MKGQTGLTHFGLSAILTACFAGSLLAQTQPPHSSPDRQTLPDIKLNTIDGREWSLHENRGSILVLNFWATWCKPCQEEIPMLVRLAVEYKKSGVKVAGVGLDEGGEKLIEKFVAEYKINYPIVIPPARSPLFSIENLPNTFLIDREGRLFTKYVGLVPESVLRGDIDKLINKTKR